MMSENTAETQTEIISAPKVGGKKVIFAASFGNALEFFDFGIYNFFVIYISVLFFPPSSDPHLALLLAFATFGVSFFMRPLGGILIGAYADRCGRKPAMILTISLMSLGTAMIGFAPTYASAGYWGTATLVAARLIQGVAAGGEVGASMSLLVESAPPNRRGFYSSWSLATQGIATVVGGVTALALSAALPVLSGEPNAMAEWGWRIPFFIGVALAPLGCWLRLGLESDRPSVARAHEPPAQLRQHSRAVVLGVMLTIGATVATYISMYYLGTYAVKYLGMAQAYGLCRDAIGGAHHLRRQSAGRALVRSLRPSAADPRVAGRDSDRGPAGVLVAERGAASCGAAADRRGAGRVDHARFGADHADDFGAVPAAHSCAGVCVGLQPRGGDLRRLRPVHRFAVDRAERFAAGARRLSDGGYAGFAGGAAIAA